MTCIEAVAFSLIFQWAYSSSEYKEGQKQDRLGMGPAQRKSTFRAIFDALNLSDIVAGTFLALQLLFMRVSSRYGGRNPRQAGFSRDDQVHLEPLQARRNVRGYDGGIPQSEMEYEQSYPTGYHPPPMPPPARDPSPGAAYGRAQMSEDAGLRPEYAEREALYGEGKYSRGNSPERVPLQQPRDMV